MKSFEKDYLSTQFIDQNLLQIIRKLGEYKGKEALYKQQSQQTLDTLIQNAIIESTESSNRIEGITVEGPKRLHDLVKKKAKPQNRPEQEIAGYRDVLKTIHSSHEDIPFGANIILQFHRDLFKYTIAPGGSWKSSDNDIIEKGPSGEKIVRFKPIPAWKTEKSMQELHQKLEDLLNPPHPIEPLLGIASYILDFLCIHPFADGNGRMARLLTLLLLYRFGYQVGRFISLERIIEETKEGYYEALYLSSQGWHEGKHSIRPWWNYFLGVMLLGAYKEFEERVGQLETSRGAKGALVLVAIDKLPMQFTVAQIIEKCPMVGIDYIRKILRTLREKGKIKSTGRGPDAAWKKIIK